MLLGLSLFLLVKFFQLTNQRQDLKSKRLIKQNLSVITLLPLCLFPSLILTLNPATKAYLYTAHFQIFNIFIPILTLYHISYVVARQQFPLHKLTLIISSGILVLSYPGSNIYIISVFFSILYLRKKAFAFTYIVCAYLPYFLWFEFIKWKNGFFYSEATSQWRQFVWIIDAYHKGNLISSFYEHFLGFYKSFLDSYTITAFFLLIFATILIFFLLPSQFRQEVNFEFTNRSILLVPLYLLALFAVGTYAPRLNWPVVIAITCVWWSFLIRVTGQTSTPADHFSWKNFSRSHTEGRRLFSLSLMFLLGVCWFFFFIGRSSPWN
jgi:hypothetical protein